MMEQHARVLVVDDEPRICDLLKTILIKIGHQVHVARSGEEALRKLSEDEFDILLADLVMPGIDGLELIRRTREQHADVATILITGYATVDTAVRALHEGVDDYITKPFNIEELRNAIQRALRERCAVHEQTQLLSKLQSANEHLEQQKSALLNRVKMADSDLSAVLGELQERVNELRAVHEIGRVVTSVLDLNKVMDLSLDLINEKLAVAVV